MVRDGSDAKKKAGHGKWYHFFKWITSRPAPSCAGGGCLLAFGSTQKEEARRAADTPGFFASHPGRRAERWGRFPTRPEVELNDSRKTRGRASGGLGAAPPVILTGGAVASRPRNSPLPKAPAAPAAFPLTARVSGCTGQDGQKAEARSIPGLWGRFSWQIRASGRLLARGVLSLP